MRRLSCVVSVRGAGAVYIAVVPAPSTVERFVRFLETSDDPGDLFSPRVFCDFNVPQWRYQFQGVEELADQIRHDDPNTIVVRRVEPTASGFVLEVEAEVRIDGTPYFERTLWLLTVDDDRVDEVTLYCSGE